MREKIEYIWTYYKGKIILGLVLLMAVISIVGGLLSQEPEPKLQLVVQSREIQGGQVPVWKEGVARQLGVKPAEVTVQTLATGMPDYMQEKGIAKMKFAALIQIKEADIILGDAESMMDSPSMESFADLKDIFSESEWKTLEQQAEKRAKSGEFGILKAVIGEEDKVVFDSELNSDDAICYFICLGNLSESVIGNDMAYAGVPKNAPNMEYIKEWIQTVLSDGGEKNE